MLLGSKWWANARKPPDWLFPMRAASAALESTRSGAALPSWSVTRLPRQYWIRRHRDRPGFWPMPRGRWADVVRSTSTGHARPARARRSARPALPRLPVPAADEVGVSHRRRPAASTLAGRWLSRGRPNGLRAGSRSCYACALHEPGAARRWARSSAVSRPASSASKSEMREEQLRQLVPDLVKTVLKSAPARSGTRRRSAMQSLAVTAKTGYDTAKRPYGFALGPTRSNDGRRGRALRVHRRDGARHRNCPKPEANLTTIADARRVAAKGQVPWR